MRISSVPHPRFALFLAVLIGAFAALRAILPLDLATALAFDAAATMFLVSVAPLWWRGSPPAMRASAARDDGGRVLLLGISVILVAVILTSLGLVLGRQTRLGIADLGLVIVTLALAWIFANLVYAFHYAHVFYDQNEVDGDNGGLRFPGGSLPDFADFCYFSFVLGMTFQVSDVEITSSRLRRVATLHGALAFFFNFGLLGLTINVLGGVL